MIQLRTILTSLLLTISTFCDAYNLEPNRWTSYEGKLGQSLIHLSFYRFDNGQIKGSYCYQNYETKILLSGQISDNKIVLTEFLSDKPNGSFVGRISSDSTDRFEGIWHDSSNTKSIEFKLKLSGICGSNFNHVYSDMYGPDEAVENFMKHVKTSIQNGEKEWISNHVRYPIKVTITKGKRTTIKNKKQLALNFEKIFNREFKDKIKSACVCNMFNRWDGVMLGNGDIWISNTPKSNDEVFDFYIIAINN